ncbi:MAG: type II toxin-antitoxin system VapC family toxin [Candidatus Bathyarchaeales archaeon]
MRYVIDSYAWIEYFMGSKAGEKVKPVIEGLEEKFTPTICLAEVYAKTLKVEGRALAEKQRKFVKERSALVPLDEAVAVKAAEIYAALKQQIEGWGLADSIVYATGIIKDARIITGDVHFRSLENVFFIK